MCIIDPSLYERGGKVNEVGATRILVAPEKGTEGRRQLTVYSNRVALGGDTKAVAMILPVPNPGNDPRNVRVVDTTDDSGRVSRLFDELRPLTHKRRPSVTSRGGGGISKGAAQTSKDDAVPMLPVEVSGSYAYTIVPRVSDFDRVQGEVLPNRPSAEVMELLQNTYDADAFSYLVCKLSAAKDAQYHPLAYTHPTTVSHVDKISSSSMKSSLFVPTLHYHGDEEDEEVERMKRISAMKKLLEDTETGAAAASGSIDGRDVFHDALTPVSTRGETGKRLALEHEERDRKKKRASYTYLYHGVPGYDVDQDEDADVFRRSDPDFPHWDHEIYMFGVAEDEAFGRRAGTMKGGTQKQLDEALARVPESYARAMDRKQPVEKFRFRRMVGKLFPNEDVVVASSCGVASSPSPSPSSATTRRLEQEKKQGSGWGVRSFLSSLF